MIRYGLSRSGAMTRSLWELGGFIKTPPDLARFDAQIGVGLQELPGATIDDDAEILEAFRDRAGTAFHVCGMCRVGADEAAVVDPQFRVRGVSGLRVVDTSIFPTPVSRNTNAPAMATALRAARMILGQGSAWRRRKVRDSAPARLRSAAA